MKSTGIIRHIDDLGRIVIPKELRRTLNIADGDPIEIFVDGERIILRKYHPDGSCSLCGTVADRYAQMSKYRICPGCAAVIIDKLTEGTLAAEERVAELETELERSETQIDRLRNEISILQEQLEQRCARV